MIRIHLAAVAIVTLPIAHAGCRTIGDDEIERGSVPLPERLPVTTELAGDDGWYEWRGPHRDGVVSGIDLPRALPSGSWPERWRVTVGEGLSGIVSKDGRVYCHSRVGNQEIVTCHDADTGKVIWSRSSRLEEDFGQPFWLSGITNGPLATPAIRAGRLYTVGVLGRVQCFDALSGDLVFDITPEELDGEPSSFTHGHASSPLVREGKVFIAYATGEAPQFIALDARTGKVLWRTLEDNVTYTSPVYVTIHDTPQIVVRTWERIVGLAPENGELLWEHRATARGFSRDCATPLVVGDLVYVTNDFHGTIAVRISVDEKVWQADRLWRSGGLAGGTASPVYHDGHLYGLHRKRLLVCLDARTGELKWKVRAFRAHLSILSFGDRILALDDRGTLAVVELSPEGYRPLATWKVGEYTWGHPGISKKGIYLRDGEDLVCLKFGA